MDRQRAQRPMTTLLAATAGLVLAGGCGGGDEISEGFLEDQIESETGGDVDLDLDDGQMRIQTDEGEIRIQTDEDGNVSISGSGDDGDFTMESEDGRTVIQSEDGSTMIAGEGTELPDDFPDDVPLPNGLEVQYSQSMSTADELGFLVGGHVDGSPGDVLTAYAAALEAAGYAQVQLTSTPDGGFFAYDDGAWTVSGGVGDDPVGGTQFTITVATSSG